MHNAEHFAGVFGRIDTIVARLRRSVHLREYFSLASKLTKYRIRHTPQRFAW